MPDMLWRRRKRVMLVTGASGFLGRHLSVASEAQGWEIVAPPSTVMDVRGRDKTIDEIRTWKPNAVVHLAYRQGDRRTIVEGSRNVAEGAAISGARLIHVSTDLVFAGRPAPYGETDRPDPRSDYGRWKAEAEDLVDELHPSAVIVRTSLLYGTDRLSPAQDAVEQVCQGRSTMRFFTDEVRSVTHAHDVAEAISNLAAMEFAGVLHVASPEGISRADFARDTAAWLGYDPALIPTATLAESGTDRPGRVVLNVTQAESLGLACRTLAEWLDPT